MIALLTNMTAITAANAAISLREIGRFAKTDTLTSNRNPPDSQLRKHIAAMDGCWQSPGHCEARQPCWRYDRGSPAPEFARQCWQRMNHRLPILNTRTTTEMTLHRLEKPSAERHRFSGR